MLLACLALPAIVTSALVSHAAALPAGRTTAIAGQVVHLVGAAAWIGAVLHLALARRLLSSPGDPASVVLASRVLRRFSPVALAAAGLLGLTGV
ncbi:MAG: hypothetical protein ACKO2K_13485, partial [Alphaproteobacteria bacterium]